MAVDPPAPPRSVAAKVLGVLSAFEADQARLSLTQIATHADLPLPTAHRIVGELVEFGALRRDEHGRYRIGRRIWRAAQNAGRELRDTARPHLADLYQRTGHGSHLAIRDGGLVMVVDRMYGSGRPLGAAEAGDRLPLHLSAAGKILLAYEEPMIRTAYVDAAPPPGAPFEAADLAAELDRIRAQGWATNERTETGSASLAVPVLVGDAAMAAIGIAVSSAAAPTVRRHLGALQATAAEMVPEVRRWPNSRAIVHSLTTSA